MLALLAVNWHALLFRAALAMLFGILALFWPGLTLNALVLLFGTYALIDGIVALIVASQTRGLPDVLSLLFAAGLVRTGAAVVTFAYPGITAIALLKLIAAWAALSSLVEIATAIALRKEMTGAWPLPVAGATSVVFAVLLMLNHEAGALALAWLIGVYAFFFGMLLLALALRLQALASEMPSALANRVRSSRRIMGGAHANPGATHLFEEPAALEEEAVSVRVIRTAPHAEAATHDSSQHIISGAAR